ncbi:PREDICTED: LOW QUALITY PROTEIN: long-chain fatty acid transport protein 4-like [Rhagoletis zephyria]|uniref:LOW QUALITY PROTEIN: long-chain fatty acid transport protein 4-like n=1 Tax=Rhagoletis zephyria TaxID=28612 RepID=UPI000811A9C7|nr:PREDICTED: LOW QUALITY PROTEIN: long-chain fatty acid transport protein 4-like [Rhagoletis zephyria]
MSTTTSIEAACIVIAADEVDTVNGKSIEGYQGPCLGEEPSSPKRTEKSTDGAHTTIDVDRDQPSQIGDDHASARCSNGIKKDGCMNSTAQQQTAVRTQAKSQHEIILVLTISIAATFVALLWYFFGWMCGVPAVFAAIFAVMLVMLGWRWFYIATVTTKRDTKALWSYIRLLLLIKQYERKNLSIGDIFQRNVETHPDKVAIISETQSWTFLQLSEFSNRIAEIFHSHGYKKGDVVGLMLENRAEYVGIWLGLSKCGIITALINTNLKGPSLLHSITVAKCAALIYGEDFYDMIANIASDIPAKLFQFNNEINKPVRNSAEDLATLLHSSANDKAQPFNSTQHPNHHDKLMYIYTSGTTGLPKAAVISHSRYIFIAAGIHYALYFKNKDIYYTPLPLYHTAGGVMNMGQALLFGSTVAIRKKFSASGYFADCVRFNCTIAQYIGEMARYILATPPCEHDRKHKIRMVFGNGLRPQIWPRFVERFNIPKVGEFYGATEGNANIMNNDNTVGAIGFISRIIPQIYPISIIKADPDTGEPIRGEDGLCQRCEAGECGVFIGKIIKGNPSREFLGYADERASTKKIAHDVFKKGDMAFLSGDLLTSDERGYLFFMDRTGDTFRWKGENVSTSEVEAQVSNVASYKDTIVYGVAIPNTEGRAGMAAIYDPEREVDLARFTQDIAKVLPTYARPQFIRFLTKVDLTGTCKLRKVDLQKEGYNPNIIQDALYYQTASGRYEILTSENFEKINRGEIRF